MFGTCRAVAWVPVNIWRPVCKRVRAPESLQILRSQLMCLPEQLCLGSSMEGGTRLLGPHNLCSTDHCGQLVELRSRSQHYCAACSSTDLGLSQPVFAIQLALQRRRRLLRRILQSHRSYPPSSVIVHILYYLLNDIGCLIPSARWACILMRFRVID